MSFNDLLKQYQVTPHEPKPAQPPVKEPVKPAPKPVQPVNPASVKPSRPVEPVKAAPTPAKPSRPFSDAQQLLDELEHDVHGGHPQVEPVQPLRPGKDNAKRPTARPPRPASGAMSRELPPYWYIDASLLGVTVLAGLAILANWNSILDAAMRLIMSLADMAIAIVIVLGVVFFVLLMLRRRIRLQRIRRWWRL